jgi:hypothetical protein
MSTLFDLKTITSTAGIRLMSATATATVLNTGSRANWIVFPAFWLIIAFHLGCESPQPTLSRFQSHPATYLAGFHFCQDLSFSRDSVIYSRWQ